MENSCIAIVPIGQRFFFRSKEKSKVITDVRVIGKVDPMKKREIRNIYSGGEKIYFKNIWSGFLDRNL